MVPKGISIRDEFWPKKWKCPCCLVSVKARWGRVVSTKVVFFQRKPQVIHFSVERYFREIRKQIPSSIETVLAISKYESKGLFPRLYNILEAASRQGDINHVAGDVHFLTYLLTKRKTLLTVLDCVFSQNPSWLKRSLLHIFWYTIPVRRAALISVISEATKTELLKHVKCDPARIRVVPVGISPGFQRYDKTFNAIKPRILQIGTGPNKNLLRTCKALRGIHCHLRIVGGLSPNQLSALEENGIEYTNVWGLSEEEVVAEYTQCDLMVFPSTYEGFGMPILEANAIGRPVVTSNILSMPEVAGDAACLVDPYDASSIRRGVLQVITDEVYREDLVIKGYLNVRRFDIEKIAQMYVDLYREIYEGYTNS